MVHLTVGDSFLIAYATSVGVWLVSREVRAYRLRKKENLESQVASLQAQVSYLSNQLLRTTNTFAISSLSPPVTIIPRLSETPSEPVLSDDYRADEPTNPRMRIPVEIVDDSGEVEIPETLRSHTFESAAE